MKSSVRLPLLIVSIGAAAAVGVLAAIVQMHPYLGLDASVENDVQATNWGLLALTFPAFTWIGDAKGSAFEAVAFVAILIFNRRTWLLAAAASVTGIWYQVFSHLIHRARPTTAQVLQVTEHPGGSSFPSGHTIFIVTFASVLMLCFGYRFLPTWARPIGWVIVGLTVIACAISRIDVGAHWPSDVLVGILIAAAWLTFVTSFRRISNPVLDS